MLEGEPERVTGNAKPKQRSNLDRNFTPRGKETQDLIVYKDEHFFYYYMHFLEHLYNEEFLDLIKAQLAGQCRRLEVHVMLPGERLLPSPA